MQRYNITTKTEHFVKYCFRISFIISNFASQIRAFVKQERNRKLFKDIIIYGIGNIGSRFVMLLLTPILTFFLEREEMGTYNVLLATIIFILPLTTLQMRESTFRLLVNSNDRVYKKNIISTTLFIEVGIFIILLFIALLVPLFFKIRYFELIVWSVFVYSFYEIYLQIVRVLYSAAKYALMGIITSLLTVAFALLGVIVFKRDIEAIFIANIASRIISMLFIELPKREFIRSLSIRSIQTKYIRSILSYSLPMLASALAYGVISVCGIYLVGYVRGAEENGDLAVAEKFVTIITILGITFYQAWQVTAVKNYKEKDSSAFFSEVFNRYSILLSLLVIIVAFGVRSFAPILFNEEYNQCINILFIYAASSMFYCLAMFFDIIFQCTKQISKIAYSIIVCAIIAPPLSFVLIQHYGLMGNVIAICIVYVLLFVFRYFQTKSVIPIRFSKNFYQSILLLIVGGGIFYGSNTPLIDYLTLLIASLSILYLIWISRKYIQKQPAEKQVQQDTHIMT